MTIFDRLKRNDFLSEEEDDFSGPVNLLDENYLFLFLRFCFFCFLQTFGTFSVLTILVLARVVYGLSSNVLDGSDGVLWKGTEILVDASWYEMHRTVFFRFLSVNSFTGRRGREDVAARLGNVSINVDGCIRISMFPWLYPAPSHHSLSFLPNFVPQSENIWSSSGRLRTQSRGGMCLKVLSLQLSTLLSLLYLYGCVCFLRGTYVA